MPQPGPPDSPRIGPIHAGPVLLTAGLLLLAWLLGPVLLLVFTGVLLAVGLDGLTALLVGRLSIRRGWALLIVCLAVLGALVLAGFAVVPQLVGQLGELWNVLVDGVEAAQAWLSSGWTRDLVQQLSPDGQQIAGVAGDLLARIASYGMSALGALATLAVILTLGVFLAANPGLYRGGLLRLVAPARRPLADRALSAVAYALRWWFLSQLVSMAILGVTVGLGLWLIGVEFWLSLAVLTALLTFIPYLGPIIAGAPILIVGFTAGLETGLIVTVFYLIVQNVEGSVIMPLIQQKAIDLAPALSIAVQVLMGVVFGVAGFVLAAPLTVVGMVLVQKLYVEGVLGEQV